MGQWTNFSPNIYVGTARGGGRGGSETEFNTLLTTLHAVAALEKILSRTLDTRSARRNVWAILLVGPLSISMAIQKLRRLQSDHVVIRRETVETTHTHTAAQVVRSYLIHLNESRSLITTLITQS